MDEVLAKAGVRAPLRHGRADDKQAGAFYRLQCVLQTCSKVSARERMPRSGTRSARSTSRPCAPGCAAVPSITALTVASSCGIWSRLLRLMQAAVGEFCPSGDGGGCQEQNPLRRTPYPGRYPVATGVTRGRNGAGQAKRRRPHKEARATHRAHVMSQIAEPPQFA